MRGHLHVSGCFNDRLLRFGKFVFGNFWTGLLLPPPTGSFRFGSAREVCLLRALFGSVRVRASVRFVAVGLVWYDWTSCWITVVSQ